MRILYWLPAFLPDIGGIEVLSARALPHLHALGHELAVVTSFGSHPETPAISTYAGLPIYRFDFRQPLADRDLPAIARLRREILALKQEFNPDLIHIHFSDPFVYFHLASHATFPCPTIVTIHMSTAVYRGGHDTLLGKLLRSAEWITGVSQTTLDEVHDLVPETRDRSSVIYNGLELPAIAPTPLPFAPPRLLFLGRLVDFKHCHFALETCAALQQQFPGLELLVAGDGPEKRNLLELAARLGIHDRVQFLGWVDPDQVPTLINQATVLLIPSVQVEALPLVAIQAGQQARPVIGSRIGGIPEIIRDGQTGFIIPPNDLKALIDRTAQLLSEPERAGAMGNRARANVIENFGMARYIQEYATLYEQVSESSSRALPHD